MNDKPKKPINIKHRMNGTFAACPTCGYKVLKTPFCSHCGQALDWDKNTKTEDLPIKVK